MSPSAVMPHQFADASTASGYPFTRSCPDAFVIELSLMWIVEPSRSDEKAPESATMTPFLMPWMKLLSIVTLFASVTTMPALVREMSLPRNVVRPYRFGSGDPDAAIEALEPEPTTVLLLTTPSVAWTSAAAWNLPVTWLPATERFVTPCLTDQARYADV